MKIHVGTKQNTMKTFNKVITIQIEANQIAQMLLENMNPEFKHAELVVEAVIGSSTDLSLSMLYNSLNGHTPEIDFKVGDEIAPDDIRPWGFWSEDSIEKDSSVRGNVKSAVVVEIDLYSNEKLKISYDVPQKNGSFKQESIWVKHTSCKKLVLERLIDLID